MLYIRYLLYFFDFVNGDMQRWRFNVILLRICCTKQILGVSLYS